MDDLHASRLFWGHEAGSFDEFTVKDAQRAIRINQAVQIKANFRNWSKNERAMGL
jgi:hypothetical protein